jgi:adenylyl-sulfate kinase
MPGLVYFFTGLSAAGKTTLALALRSALEERGRTITLLDGDEVRQLLSKGLGFSREDRDMNIRRIAWIAAEVARHGGAAICAAIAPYRQTRREARERVRAAGGRFVEVYVSTPLEVCEARDPKGLYARARAGQIQHFTGVDDVYEVPEEPEILLDTSGISVAAGVAELLKWAEGPDLPPPESRPRFCDAMGSGPHEEGDAIRDCRARCERGEFTMEARQAAREADGWDRQAKKLLALYDGLGG